MGSGDRATIGNSFVPVTTTGDLAVGSIAFSKSNPSVVYAGMGDTKLGYLGSGVLKSVDEGRSWSRVSNTSLPSPGTISKIEVDPTNSNRVYVAQYSKLSGAKVTSSGFYISTDGGVNWTRTQAGAARDIAVDPGDPTRLYLGLSRIDADLDPAFGLYRSTDPINVARCSPISSIPNARHCVATAAIPQALTSTTAAGLRQPRCSIEGKHRRRSDVRRPGHQPVRHGPVRIQHLHRGKPFRCEHGLSGLARCLQEQGCRSELVELDQQLSVCRPAL